MSERTNEWMSRMFYACRWQWHACMYSVPRRDSSAVTLSVDGSQGTGRLLILFTMRVAKAEGRRQSMISGIAYGDWLGGLLVGVVGFEDCGKHQSGTAGFSRFSAEKGWSPPVLNLSLRRKAHDMQTHPLRTMLPLDRIVWLKFWGSVEGMPYSTLSLEVLIVATSQFHQDLWCLRPGSIASCWWPNEHFDLFWWVRGWCGMWQLGFGLAWLKRVSSPKMRIMRLKVHW